HGDPRTDVADPREDIIPFPGLHRINAQAQPVTFVSCPVRGDPDSWAAFSRQRKSTIRYNPCRREIGNRRWANSQISSSVRCSQKRHHPICTMTSKPKLSPFKLKRAGSGETNTTGAFGPRSLPHRYPRLIRWKRPSRVVSTLFCTVAWRVSGAPHWGP